MKQSMADISFLELSSYMLHLSKIPLGDWRSDNTNTKLILQAADSITEFPAVLLNIC